jgi:ketosteroid isomerase-like protein
MDSGSVELGRRAFAALSAGDLSAIHLLFADDGSVTTETTWPGGGRFEGRDDVRRFIAQFLEGFGRVAFEETSEPEDLGEWALFHGRWTGAGRASGIETATREFHVAVSARQGQITEMRFFWDEREARAYLAQ